MLYDEVECTHVRYVKHWAWFGRIKNYVNVCYKCHFSEPKDSLSLISDCSCYVIISCIQRYTMFWKNICLSWAGNKRPFNQYEDRLWYKKIWDIRVLTGQSRWHVKWFPKLYHLCLVCWIGTPLLSSPRQIFSQLDLDALLIQVLLY